MNDLGSLVARRKGLSQTRVGAFAPSQTFEEGVYELLKDVMCAQQRVRWIAWSRRDPSEVGGNSVAVHVQV
jgi:hypothetical protein